MTVEISFKNKETEERIQSLQLCLINGHLKKRVVLSRDAENEIKKKKSLGD